MWSFYIVVISHCGLITCHRVEEGPMDGRHCNSTENDSERQNKIIVSRIKGKQIPPEHLGKKYWVDFCVSEGTGTLLHMARKEEESGWLPRLCLYESLWAKSLLNFGDSERKANLLGKEDGEFHFGHVKVKVFMGFLNMYVCVWLFIRLLDMNLKLIQAVKI